jgi:hypothetical protein
MKVTFGGGTVAKEDRDHIIFAQCQLDVLLFDVPTPEFCWSGTMRVRQRGCP